MDTLVLARHGESVASAAGRSNGDPAEDLGLTITGRQQARLLGGMLIGAPIALAVSSAFPRTRQTAAIALEGRALPHLVLPQLDDIRYGKFEGGKKEKAHAWLSEHPLDRALPGGGESRVQVAHRACTGFETILDRPEPMALVVTHELIVSDLLFAVAGQDPLPAHLDIPYATPYRFSAEALRDAIVHLQRWIASFE
ncbi:MAG TPA: histidine phosphatase family protein [Chloroflexota bacterium]|nr:histidine phosphatase family protein [Chloroflexota bacterium]